MGNAEYCWTDSGRLARHIVWSIGATNAQRVGHPTQKPVEVMLFTLREIGAGSLVLDPFMGSGTTGIACIRTGRRFIGIEREPAYFDAACERIRSELSQPYLPELPPRMEQLGFFPQNQT